MLTDLVIRNFAIIDELRVTFTEGLNVLTGETGAGKSIIIGAVSLLLGDRASADMIRTSEDSAQVEAVFNLRGQESLVMLLRDWGIQIEEELVLRRVVSRSGKNRIYINGNAATLTMLSTLGERLMNICGQHEHQVLLKEENHVDILDEFGDILPLRRKYAAAYQNVLTLREKKGRLEAMRRRKEDRQEFIQFQLDEIVGLDPKAGEDESLAEEKKILSNIQRLSDLAVGAHDILYGGEGAILEKFHMVLDAVRDIRQIDPRLAVADDEFASLYYQIEEVAFTLRDYAKGLSFDPVRLEAIDDRLERLGRLKRKHGGHLDAVLAKKVEMEGELKQILAADEELGIVSASLDQSMERIVLLARDLSETRRKAALKLQQAIDTEIHTLHMTGARFEVVFREYPSSSEGDRFRPHGTDDVVFYLTTNAGEAPKPLNRIASGGELSRVVLAMKKILAGAGFEGTIVFDEVDSGIGGATAQIVGEKIREVARRHQVLCITHLPQIACFADSHYRVSKRVGGEKTITSVDLLSDMDRLEEMARMLSGVDVTETTRKHAREMLAAAGKFCL
jgi:DNA repair protein RecN (Recombination protein N)